MKINEIRLRDPFILPYGDAYYMYGTRLFDYENGEKYQDGIDVYKSFDLENWSEAGKTLPRKGDFKDIINFWAPEVYEIDGSFYMLVSLKGTDGNRRGTYVFKSDTPDGEFKLHSNGPVTPREWECLDGTLVRENGKLYMVFCHEWVQCVDGTMCVAELSADLRERISEPVELFKASDAKWIRKIGEGYITDGPFMFKEDGVLYMLWSSDGVNGYVEALAYSENGSVFGEWKQCEDLIFNNNGGHGMLFEDFDKNRRLVLHSPHGYVEPAPVVFDFVKMGKGKYECRQAGLKV